MNVYRYETPKELISKQSGPVIFLAGPTVRGNQQHLQPSWRFKATELFAEYGFTGSIVIPEFTDLTESDKGRVELPIWEHNGLTKADCILFWINRTRELWGLNTNSEHGFWLGKDPLKLVYGRPDDAFRIQYNDIMHDRIYSELGTQRPIYSTLEDTVKASIEMANQLYFDKEKAIWREETLMQSSPDLIYGNKHYENIINMGEIAIKFMLNDMYRNDEFLWTKALRELTGSNPLDEDDAGIVKAIVNKWLKWAKERGIEYEY